MLLDPNYPIYVGGWASPDFTKFSIVDAVQTGPNTVDGRIRILDQNFNVLVSRVESFTLINLAYALAVGGKFSEDGKYLNVYVTDGATPNSSTSFFVYRTSDLVTVASKNFPFVNSFQASEFITFGNRGKKQYFVTFQSGTGYYSNTSTTNIENTLKPPYFIQVYKVNFNDATLDLVDQSPLPKFADVNVDVLRMEDKALIAHGGFCSLFPNQLSIYDTNNLKTTSLPHDNAEARVLKFDGKKLKVIFKQATNCCCRLLFYPPNQGRTYMFGQNIVTNINGDPRYQTTLQEFYVLANICSSNGQKRLVSINLPRQDVARALPIFSNNGKWFLRTGEYGYYGGNPNVDAVGVHNVLLFKVI